MNTPLYKLRPHTWPSHVNLQHSNWLMVHGANSCLDVVTTLSDSSQQQPSHQRLNFLTYSDGSSCQVPYTPPHTQLVWVWPCETNTLPVNPTFFRHIKQRFFFGVLGVLSSGGEAGRSDRGVACTSGSRPTALVHTTHGREGREGWERGTERGGREGRRGVGGRDGEGWEGGKERGGREGRRGVGGRDGEGWEGGTERGGREGRRGVGGRDGEGWEGMERGNRGVGVEGREEKVKNVS